MTKMPSAIAADTSVAVLWKKSERPVCRIDPHVHRKQLRAEPLGRVDDVELQKAGKLVCGEDRCLRQLAVTAAVICAVDRSGQHQLGCYQRDDGKACNNKSGKRRQP
jgi:hypothetical protein